MLVRAVGVPGGVGGSPGGGVGAEADPDRLVVAALFGMDKVGQHPPVRSGGLAT